MPNSDSLVIVISDRDPSIVGEVEKVAPGAEVRVVTEEELITAAEDADVVATVRMSPEALRNAGKLKWVQSLAAGPDAILHDEMRKSPIPLTCCKGNGAVPLAEHAIMLMLMLDRDARRLLAAQADHRWDKSRHDELNGKTCGIIGVGCSGTDLAIKAKAFHMKVLGLRRQDRPAEHFDEMFTGDRLHDFLAQSDFVVVSAALTPETEGMLGEAEFRAMKSTAHYICFSRGAIADPDALASALKNKWIAGAGLDAHAVEPLPEDSPFWSMPNVIVTPHMGATSHGTLRRGNEIFLENLRRFLSGQPFVNLVDKSAGY